MGEFYQFISLHSGIYSDLAKIGQEVRSGWAYQSRSCFWYKILTAFQIITSNISEIIYVSEILSLLKKFNFLTKLHTLEPQYVRDEAWNL